MGSFSRGWSFLQQVWQMALKDKDLIKPSIYALIVGVGLGILIFPAFTMVASIISTYIATAYHRCLYLGARNVEVAQNAGQPIRVVASAPLAAVLGSF